MTTAQAMQRLRRADLVEGVGIHVGPSAVALAHVRKRFLRVSLEGVAVEALPPASEAPLRRERLVAAVRAFVAARAIDPRRAALVLPRSAVMVSRVLLPVAARENLSQVLEYEIENLVPLPREEIHYAYSTRPSGEERVAVTLLCVPRAVLQEHLDALAEGGVRPRVVTVTSFALADWAAFATEHDGAVGIVVAEGETVDVSVLDGKDLVTTQLLPQRLVGTPDGFAQGVTRVLDERPVANGMPVYGWRLGAAGELVGATGETALLGLGRERLETATDFFDDASAAALPAVGGALGVVREATVEVNLLPADQRRGSEDGMSLATIAMAALVGVLLLVLGTSTLLKDELLHRSVTSRIEALAPQVEEVRLLQDEIDALDARLDVLDEGQDSRAVELVQTLTDLVPSSAYLTTLAFRRGRVTMDGHATSASDVLTALEKSRRFKNVAFSSPTTRAGDKERFALAAEVGR
jgi:Tfp pilus assembly protein PilN